MALNLALLAGLLLIVQHQPRSMAVGSNPTATEAPGGLFGGSPGLRCPVNLSGIGPTWRTITVGQSTVEDLQNLYADYGPIGEIGTPRPPVMDVYPQVEAAENYRIFIDWRQAKSELGLPNFVAACVVNDKVAALNVYVEGMPELPQTITDLIGMLGPPTRISFHEVDQTVRLLHWPQYGISASLEEATSGGFRISFIVYYPFMGADYEEHWPMNALVPVVPTPHSTIQPTLVLDTIRYNEVEEQLTAHPRATRTPHSTTAPE